MVAISCSSFSEWEPKMFHIAFLHNLTRRFYTPPTCGALSGLNVLFIFNLAAFSSSWVRLKVVNSSRKSRVDPTKIEPLSFRKVFEQLRLATKPWMASRQLCVSNADTFCKWTALVLKQVNRQNPLHCLPEVFHVEWPKVNNSTIIEKINHSFQSTCW